MQGQTRMFTYIYRRYLGIFQMPLRQDTPYRDENWHALSHQQFFLTSHFLDICL